MISEAKLRELLGQAESETVDFKREPYKLDNDHFKSKFIKDVIAMANTPRDSAAYIIIGVKLHPDGSRDLLGVATHLDDADLHPVLNNALVSPKPSFIYQPITVDDKSYGVIEIPVDKNGPYYAGCDYGVLKAHRIYFRRGTMNDEATAEECKAIYRWSLKGPEDTVLGEDNDELQILNWDEFMLACHHFDKNRLYLFILGPESQKPRNIWKSLARLPISMFLDFDPNTAEDGIYSLVAPVMSNTRSVHLWTLGNETTLVPERACYWYAARGLEGRESSLSVSGWRDWNRKYGTALNELIGNFVRASGGRPLTVVSLWYAPEYIREICCMVDRTFGDSADYVFAVPESEGFKELADQFDGKTISIRTEDILHGITRNVAAIDDATLPIAGVPQAGGGFHVLERSELAWLSEDLEVLHSNIELEVDKKRVAGYDYLRGVTIDWVDLAGHYDADREETPQIRGIVVSDLNSRKATRLNLYHWPGAGGTTVAHRVAWDLRQSYPVVMLRRVTPGETVSRFRELFKATGLTVLAIVEGSDAIPDRLELLYTEVRAENIPVVFLSVLRRFDTPSGSKRTVFLDQTLELPEARRFADAYKRVAPHKADALEGLLFKEPRERTPFQFALTAFGKNFIGITRYVGSRLEVATSTQRDLMTYLALAYYYGHKPVLSQVFAVHLGQPENRPVHLERVLDEPQLELLVQESDKWRPSHQLIAEKILEIVLSGGATERRNWERNLPSWALSFIEVCHNSSLTPSDDLIDLLRRVFILRDEHELLGTESSATSKFARLIEDIRTNEGKLSVLKALADSFPEEAHFWGHLGRFYSNPMGEPDKAIEALDKAICLSPNDPVLHHMKGMCCRQMAYDRMDDLRNRKPARDQVMEIQNMVGVTLDTFAKARELDPDSEHAYISPIQMLIKVLDFGYQVSGCDSQSEFLGSPSASWYRERLDEAENLLEQVQSIREGEKLSQYTLGCQAGLHRIYDDYARALQDWNNLLERADVYAPPIRRQIVRTYLARSHRDWSALEPREVERIVDLMEDNLREEPASEHNIRLWFHAIRYSQRQNIDLTLDRLAYWKAVGDSQDAYYYLYILHVLKAIEGSTIERVRSEGLIEQCANKARYRRNRTNSFEWLGRGVGLSRLVHYSELGEWDEDANFYTDISDLVRVKGHIAKIKGPEAGAIELASCELPVFFVPAKAGAQKGRHENFEVDFYLGFSYDGLRAWSVEFVNDRR